MISKTNFKHTAERPKTPEGKLRTQTLSSGVEYLYIPADTPTLCRIAKKEDVAARYGMGYALYKSSNGRMKINDSVGVFRPTGGFVQRTTLEQSGERARGTTE